MSPMKATYTSPTTSLNNSPRMPLAVDEEPTVDRSQLQDVIKAQTIKETKNLQKKIITLQGGAHNPHYPAPLYKKGKRAKMQTRQDPPKVKKKDHPPPNAACPIKEKVTAHPTMLHTTLHKAEETEGTPGSPKSLEEPHQQDATDPVGDLQQDQASLWVYC
eukprot:8945864-Ditylum_brightwellii.AAC.1